MYGEKYFIQLPQYRPKKICFVTTSLWRQQNSHIQHYRFYSKPYCFIFIGVTGSGEGCWRSVGRTK